MGRVLSVFPALLLAGCIFNSDPAYTSGSFQVGFYATLGNVPAYDAQGRVTGSLGFGAEDAAYLPVRTDQAEDAAPSPSDDQDLRYGDAWKNPWISYYDTSHAVEYYEPLEGHSYVLSLQRDSTKILAETFSANPLFPTGSTRTLHAYAGMPCTFSRLRGSVWNAAANAGIPVMVTSLAVRLVNDTLRLSMILDTAASRAAHPAIEFSREWLDFYGTMKVTCP